MLARSYVCVYFPIDYVTESSHDRVRSLYKRRRNPSEKCLNMKIGAFIAGTEVTSFAARIVLEVFTFILLSNEYSHWARIVFHARCRGFTKAAVQKMPQLPCQQHACTSCSRNTTDAGGMLFRYAPNVLTPSDLSLMINISVVRRVRRPSAKIASRSLRSHLWVQPSQSSSSVPILHRPTHTTSDAWIAWSCSKIGQKCGKDGKRSGRR